TRELGSRGITANVVAPGFIRTDMTDELSEKQRSEYLSTIPAKRFAEAEEVAKVVRWVASDEAADISAAVLPVAGGLGMGHGERTSGRLGCGRALLTGSPRPRPERMRPWPAIARRLQTRDAAVSGADRSTPLKKGPPWESSTESAFSSPACSPRPRSPSPPPASHRSR